MNDYDFWQRALAGEEVGGPTLPLHEDSPQPGFWRKRISKAGGYLPTAIWRGEDGALIGLLDGRETNPVDLWTYCCRFPISEEHYRARVATGKWHDEDSAVTASLSPPPAGIGDNNPPTDPAEVLKGQIDAALAGVADYGAIGSDATAAKAQSLRSRLLDLSREADKTRETLKRPHFEAGKAVDEVFQPMVKAAKSGADLIAKELSAHETRKAREEADKIAKERLRLAEEQFKHAPLGAPEPPPEPIPAPVAAPIKGAYGRAAAVKVVKIATVTDQDAAYGYLKSQPELAVVIQKLAQRIVDAGMTVPGVTIEEQRKVS